MGNTFMISMGDFQPHELEDYIIHKPDHIILMQYTGLKDSKGVEIYEGDIVRTDTGGTTFDGKETKKVFRYWEIRWDEDGALVDGSYGPEEWMYGYIFPHSEYEGKKMEVIGNIYENPELLNV